MFFSKKINKIFRNFDEVQKLSIFFCGFGCFSSKEKKCTFLKIETFFPRVELRWPTLYVIIDSKKLYTVVRPLFHDLLHLEIRNKRKRIMELYTFPPFFEGKSRGQKTKFLYTHLGNYVFGPRPPPRPPKK